MLKKISILLSVLLLCACTGKKVSHNKYQKIENDMSRTQVTKILGKPSDEKAINIAGMSALAASWKNKNGTIVVTFVNDQVTSKFFRKTQQ